MKTIFEYSAPGRKAAWLPECDVPQENRDDLIPPSLQRKHLDFPEVAEMDLIRHYTNLSRQNFCIDTVFYPLGSCTMKYNPKVHEQVAALPGFARVHPLQPEESVQGALEALFVLQNELAEISGMDAATLQPVAGAHGEMTGMLMVHAYYEQQGEHQRKVVLVPESAHGTNPATAARCGYRVVQIKADSTGRTDLADLDRAMNHEVAAVMLTNPNTLGLFETGIAEIAEIVHGRGGMLYCDGANLNAMMGVTRPGDMGFDVMHFNLHKTFTTPHGGGGPGAGAVSVKSHLAPFLPVPLVTHEDGRYRLSTDRPLSIGRVHAFHGNFGNSVRCLAYIRSLGAAGIRRVAENAVLNANYLLSLLNEAYLAPYGDRCMHEFVLSATRQKDQGVRALDIAKRLLDLGYHAPTIYFPLIVRECLMIEPTETESKETLEAFAEAMLLIAREAETSPEMAQAAPLTTPVGRLDESRAARRPDLSWPAGGQ